MEPVTTLETVLRRDRAVVTAGLVGVAALGWVYLLYLARGMAGMDMRADMAMPQMQTWGVVDLALLFVLSRHGAVPFGIFPTGSESVLHWMVHCSVSLRSTRSSAPGSRSQPAAAQTCPGNAYVRVLRGVCGVWRGKTPDGFTGCCSPV